MTNPDNYRHNTPPYGWKVEDGKLVPYKAELVICRQVVTLVKQRLSFNETAKRLVDLRFKNRKGKVRWDHSMIISIYDRWKDKL